MSTKASDADAYKMKVETGAQTEADYNRTTKNTDASAYKTRTEAEALSHAVTKNAEADLTKKLKEAEGMMAMAEAYGKMSQALGGPAGLLQYMMIEKGTYVELAKANATAIKGMEPKISVWNTGSETGSGGSQDPAATMRNVSSRRSTVQFPIYDSAGVNDSHRYTSSCLP